MKLSFESVMNVRRPAFRSPFSVSPDGRWLAFASVAGYESTGIQQMTYDLWVASIGSAVPALDGQHPRCVARGVYLKGPTFTWSDDRTILYTTAGPLADGSIWAVQAYGASTPYCVANSGDISFQREFDAPFILNNGDALLVGRGRLWRMIRETGEVVEIGRTCNRRVVAVLPMDRKMMTGQDDPWVITQTYEPGSMRSGFYRLYLSSDRVECLLEEPCKHYHGI